MIETPKSKTRAQRAVIGVSAFADEIGIAAAMVLLGVGGWLAWRPLAFLIPGGVLLWCVLPARNRFIARAELVTTDKKRRTA